MIFIFATKIIMDDNFIYLQARYLACYNLLCNTTGLVYNCGPILLKMCCRKDISWLEKKQW